MRDYFAWVSASVRPIISSVQKNAIEIFDNFDKQDDNFRMCFQKETKEQEYTVKNIQFKNIKELNPIRSTLGMTPFLDHSRIRFKFPPFSTVEPRQENNIKDNTAFQINKQKDQKEQLNTSLAIYDPQNTLICDSANNTKISSDTQIKEETPTIKTTQKQLNQNQSQAIRFKIYLQHQWEQILLKIQSRSDAYNQLGIFKNKIQSEKPPKPPKPPKPQKITSPFIWKLGSSSRRISNNCYMNSVLQCLHKTYELKKHLLENGRPINRNPLKDYYLHLCEKMDQQFLSTSGIILIKDVISKDNSVFQGFDQQDAAQWLLCFLRLIHEEMNENNQSRKIVIDQSLRYTEDQQNVDELYQLSKQKDEGLCKSIIDDIFTGRYKTVYQCTNCHLKYIVFQKFFSVYLNVPNNRKKPTLANCFQNFSQKQMLRNQNRLYCNQCKCQTDTEKQMTVYQTNNILVICLERSQDTHQGEQDVQIPFQLDQSILKNVRTQGQNFTYKLYGMINHRGTKRGGHYIANCLNQDTYWYNYNDQVCRPIDRKEAQLSAKKAYALFYRLQEHQDRFQSGQTSLAASYIFSQENVEKSITKKINEQNHSSSTTEQYENQLQ